MPNDNFIWTEEMVKELVAEAHRHGFHREPLGIYDRIQKFKQSKIKEKERPTHVCPHCGLGLILPEQKEETDNYTREYVRKKWQDAPQQTANQPLSGELITKEECEARAAKAFRLGRKRKFIGLAAGEFMYENYQDYKKHNQ